jgi:hypothetical protein
MALCRFAVKHLGRLTARAPVAQHVAYIMREGDYAPAQAHLRYLFRESEATRSREDLVHKEAQNLPAWTQGSPACFFAAAEQYERANGRFATTWEIAVPRELGRAEQLETVRAFLQTQFGARQPYAWAMHESHASDGGTNPHVHVLFSERTLDGLDRSPQQFFRRYNPETPERGGAKKDPVLHQLQTVARQRQAWTDVANWSLERAGVDARLDPRRVADRGIDRAPEPRLAPYHSTQAKYHGTLTPAWAHTLNARENRTQDTAQEQASARAYWDKRRVAIGLTPEMTHEAMIARVTRTMHDPSGATQERVTMQQLTQQVTQGTRALQALEQHQVRLHGAVLLAEAQARMGRSFRDRDQQRAEALLTQGAALGLEAMDVDMAVGRGVRVRFQPERGQGYGW